MAATAEPPVAQVARPHNGALDRAAGIELLGPVHGSGYREGAALVRATARGALLLGPPGARVAPVAPRAAD